MSARSQSRVFDAIRKSVLEYLVLLAVWMLFVSMMKRQEFIAGALAALIASVADASIKSAKFARFKPRMQWLPLIFWEAWYALDGSWAIMAAMVKHIAGKKSEAEFVSIRMQAGGDDAESWARRTLMTAYLTIPPNFIVLGIDIKEQRMLVHQVSKTGVPLIAQKLGASKEAIMEAPQARGPRHARRDGVEA